MTDYNSSGPTGVPAAPPPPPPARPGSPALPSASSPDGSVTYTPADAGPVRQVYGSGPNPAAVVTGPPRHNSPSRYQRKPSFFGGMLRGLGIRLAFGAVLLVGGGIYAFFSSSVSVHRLEPGDCFEAITEFEVANVAEQDCSAPHGGEVYAAVTGSSAGLSARCEAAFTQGLANGSIALTEFPADALFSYLQGEGEHLCLIESPSGQLVGQLVRG